MTKRNFTLNFGGDDRVFWTGIGAMRIFNEKTGKFWTQIFPPSEPAKNAPQAKKDAYNKGLADFAKYLPDLIHACLAYGYVRQGINCEFTIYDVSEMIDHEGGIGGPQVIKFIEGFTKNVIAPQSNKQVDPSTRKSGSKKK